MTLEGGGGLIWLASYPKSGNTWARVALCSLWAEGAQLALADIARFAIMPTNRRLFDDWLEVEADNLTHEELALLRPALHDALAAGHVDPQLLKVHDRWHRTEAGRPVFDQSHTRGAIYIIRDPRDVVVSWARFTNHTIDWAIANIADRDSGLNASRERIAPHIGQWLGDWSTHVTSWLDESGLSPMVVRYEDMHADLAGTLTRIATYLGRTASPDAISGAVIASRFERLADQERRNGFSEIPDSAARFFVSGRAGGWRDILTPEQAATVERDHAAVMRRFGYL